MGTILKVAALGPRLAGSVGLPWTQQANPPATSAAKDLDALFKTLRSQKEPLASFATLGPQKGSIENAIREILRTRIDIDAEATIVLTTKDGSAILQRDLIGAYAQAISGYILLNDGTRVHFSIPWLDGNNVRIEGGGKATLQALRDRKAFSLWLNRQAFQLYQDLAREPDGFVFSPIAIHNPLLIRAEDLQGVEQDVDSRSFYVNALRVIADWEGRQDWITAGITEEPSPFRYLVPWSNEATEKLADQRFFTLQPASPEETFRTLFTKRTGVFERADETDFSVWLQPFRSQNFSIAFLQPHSNDSWNTFEKTFTQKQTPQDFDTFIQTRLQQIQGTMFLPTFDVRSPSAPAAQLSLATEKVPFAPSAQAFWSVPPAQPQITLNRPFLFVVLHNTTGAIVLMGRVLTPRYER